MMRLTQEELERVPTADLWPIKEEIEAAIKSIKNQLGPRAGHMEVAAALSPFNDDLALLEMIGRELKERGEPDARRIPENQAPPDAGGGTVGKRSGDEGGKVLEQQASKQPGGPETQEVKRGPGRPRKIW